MPSWGCLWSVRGPSYGISCRCGRRGQARLGRGGPGAFRDWSGSRASAASCLSHWGFLAPVDFAAFARGRRGRFGLGGVVVRKLARVAARLGRLLGHFSLADCLLRLSSALRQAGRLSLQESATEAEWASASRGDGLCLECGLQAVQGRARPRGAAEPSSSMAPIPGAVGRRRAPTLPLPLPEREGGVWTPLPLYVFSVHGHGFCEEKC